MVTNNFDLKINQNLLALFSSYLALGIAEFYNLKTLYWLSLVFSFLMTAYVIIAMFGYTYKYVIDKINKTR